MRTARVRAVAQSWLPLCLAALCAPVFAQPTCPSSLAGMIALGTGSCTVSGLGTVSNFRFSTSTTNGGASWNTASSSSGLGPGYVILAFGTGSAAGVGPSDSTSTFNLAFNLVPPAGNTLTGASYSLGYSFGVSPAPSFSGAESLCLNGVFTGFPPTSCSGATQTLTVPLVQISNAAPQNPAPITFSASSADVFITGTGSGDLVSLGPNASFTLTPSSITAVLNGASFQPGISPASWMTINGTNLSSTTDTWANAIVNGALPTMLDGVSVSVGGQPAYIEYVSPTQINAVVPNVAAGSVPVTVTSAIGTTPAVMAQLSDEQPAFFQWGTYAVATRQDFSIAVKNGTFAGTTTVPAAPGDVIILWGTGFGPTSPSAPEGEETPSTPTYYTANTVSVTVGGTPATVYGTALAPGYAGLYQVAIQIPASLANGDYPVVATIDGVSSPSTTLITVQK
jgi:uncharacterized protein (TIGR03437 family)